MKRNILVTGANRGIGLAIIKTMSENSQDTLLLGSRDLAAGEKEAKNLSENVHAVELDLGKREKTTANMDRIIQQYGDIDVLINNAGIMLSEGFLDLLDIDKPDGALSTGNEKIDQALRVNYIAPMQLVQMVMPGMISKKYGRIVNVSSGWGSTTDGLTGPFTYSLTKANINAMTQSIARALPRDIKINTMCPGWVRTRMGGMGASRSPAKGAETAVYLANLDANGPSGKFFRDMKQIPW